MSSPNSWIDDSGRHLSAPHITELAAEEVFVFGSNARGHHGGGAARVAHERFGAAWGEGHGLHGQSYAIDSMSGLVVLEEEIRTFLAFAARNTDRTFLVTEIGCGIAGYTPQDVAPFFVGATANVALPATFAALLSGPE